MAEERAEKGHTSMGEQAPALRIFCGYAHEDNALFQRLKTALTVFIRQEAVSI